MTDTIPQFGATIPISGRPRFDQRVDGLRTPLRLRHCMLLQYDPVQRRWNNAFRKTPHPEQGLHSTRHTPAQRAMRESTLHPIVLGLCLTVCPPLGVTLAWTSTALPREGKLAITAFGGFIMMLGAALVAIAALK